MPKMKRSLYFICNTACLVLCYGGGVGRSLCPDRVETGVDVVEHGEICFEIHHKFMEWTEAKDKCSSESRILAKITESLPKDIMGQIVDRVTESRTYRINVHVWIGLSDLQEEGEWEWLDGTSASDVTWGFNADAFREFEIGPGLEKSVSTGELDCGRLSIEQEGKQLEWEKAKCSSKSQFVCQYVSPVAEESPVSTQMITSSTVHNTVHVSAPVEIKATQEHTSSPVTNTVSTPVINVNATKGKEHTSLPVTSEPLIRKRRTRKRKSSTKYVIMKTAGVKVVGWSLLDTRFPAVTMCSRACASRPGCTVFNYNSVSLQCRGFSCGNQLTFQPHPDWDRWDKSNHLK